MTFFYLNMYQTVGSRQSPTELLTDGSCTSSLCERPGCPGEPALVLPAAVGTDEHPRRCEGPREKLTLPIEGHWVLDAQGQRHWIGDADRAGEGGSGVSFAK